MISRRIRTILSFGLIWIVLSCGGDKDQTIKDNISSEKPVPAAVDSPSRAISLPPAFTIEDAETMVAKHYSALNQHEGFIRYKGLGIAISTIQQVSTDTFSVEARVTGRRVIDINKDTSSKPFTSDHFFKAFILGNSWNAEFSNK